MGFTIVACERGHRFKAMDAYRGKIVHCPQCQAHVPIPIQSSSTAAVPTAKDPLSDTGVMRILGDLDPLPPPPVGTQSEESTNYRNCPRCSVSIRTDATLCNHCNCYVGAIPDFFGGLSNEAS